MPGEATWAPLAHGGALVRVSAQPPIGAVAQVAPDIAPLKAFAKIVKPLRIEADYLGDAGPHEGDDEAFARSWLARLD